MELNVNTDAVVAFTNKLEKLHRAAFPVAVRTALNSAAFDMKKTTIQKSAAEEFTIRKATFFKANSRVELAKGFDIKNMESAVGFKSNKSSNSIQSAINDLEQQEHGGKIEDRDYIVTGKLWNQKDSGKSIRPNERLKGLNIIKTKNVAGKNEKEKFVKSVFHAGVGGHVLSEYNDKSYVWKVNSLKRTSDGNFKLTPLYSFKKGRDVNVDATHFMSKATDMTTKKIEDFYIKAAEFQFKKALA